MSKDIRTQGDGSFPTDKPAEEDRAEFGFFTTISGAPRMMTRRAAEAYLLPGQTLGGSGTAEDPWFEPEPPLAPEDEEEAPQDPMPAEESVEETFEGTEESVEEGFGLEGPEDRDYGTPEVVVPARLLVIGSARWDLQETVHAAITKWMAAHSITHLTVITTGCPTGAEAATRTHPYGFAFTHEVIRDEDLHRSGANAALFFIRDHSNGASELLDVVESLRVPVTVYREQSVVDHSPWQNH